MCLLFLSCKTFIFIVKECTGISLLLLSTSGDAIGLFSAPLKQIAGKIPDNIDQSSFFNNLSWIDLFSAKSVVSMIYAATVMLSARFRFSPNTQKEKKNARFR